jgi:hypothetical protein
MRYVNAYCHGCQEFIKIGIGDLSLAEAKQKFLTTSFDHFDCPSGKHSESGHPKDFWDVDWTTLEELKDESIS